MAEIIVGTTNEAKVQQIRGALRNIGIVVNGVEDKSLLPDVKEDGLTAIDNARKKALAYSASLGHTVLSMDNALYIHGLNDNQQPGLHVRRIDGVERSSDEDLIKYYVKTISSLGDTAKAHWEFGVCVANPKGLLGETKIVSPERIFTTKVGAGAVPGYPLDSIQIDPISGKYFSEMRQQETDEFWQQSIGKELSDFVASLGL